MEDTVVTTLEFANGAIGTLEAATSVYPGYQRRVEVTGSEGTIILEHDRIIAADLRTPLVDAIIPTEANSNASATSPIVSDVRGHGDCWKISCSPLPATAGRFVMALRDGAASRWCRQSMNPRAPAGL